MNAKNFFVLLVCWLAMYGCLSAQEELETEGKATRTWAMIGVSRTWLPVGGAANSGLASHFAVPIGSSVSHWFGVSILGNGIQGRDILSCTIGPSTFLLGNGAAGIFAIAQVGVSISSGNALSGFTFFNDPTTVVGGAAFTGIGGTLEVLGSVAVHTMVFGSWFSTDGSQTPVGVQLGISFGGK
jgi:hypothetical protein